MSSRRVPGRFPEPGSSEIADRIRKRRGARGITPLDATLLHFPPFADGWNSLLGAIRTKGNLPGDVRELMILRIAARNKAAYEWIHHEPVGRSHGLTTLQLLIIRDISGWRTSRLDVLKPLQSAALAFTDASTIEVQVPDPVFDALRGELENLVREGKANTTVDDLLVECAAVVSTYNMVSRFLVSLDVAGTSNDIVPFPFDRDEHTIPNPSGSLHVVTIKTDPSNPWIVFSNSLLTNLFMWSPIVQTFLREYFNLIFHDQRGHGRSTIPSPPKTTITEMADDIAIILDHLNIPEVLAVVGVSQGGAVALSFGIRHSARTRYIVACDTQAKTPPANIKAWDDRLEVARKEGMEVLARATAARWFPPGSPYHPDTQSDSSDSKEKLQMLLDMMSSTPLLGFEAGARALQDYDLIADGLLDIGGVQTLLIAGEKDGTLPKVLKELTPKFKAGHLFASFEQIAGSGHLPMLDNPEEFSRLVVELITANRSRSDSDSDS